MSPVEQDLKLVSNFDSRLRQLLDLAREFLVREYPLLITDRLVEMRNLPAQRFDKRTQPRVCLPAHTNLGLGRTGQFCQFTIQVGCQVLQDPQVGPLVHQRPPHRGIIGLCLGQAVTDGTFAVAHVG